MHCFQLVVSAPMRMGSFDEQPLCKPGHMVLSLKLHGNIRNEGLCSSFISLKQAVLYLGWWKTRQSSHAHMS